MRAEQRWTEVGEMSGEWEGEEGRERREGGREELGDTDHVFDDVNDVTGRTLSPDVQSDYKLDEPLCDYSGTNMFVSLPSVFFPVLLSLT